MFKGNKINLRIMEKEDLPTYAKWMNDPAFLGEFIIPLFRPLASFEKTFGEVKPDSATFIIETKDGIPAGWVSHFMTRFGGYQSTKEIGYMVAPEHRKKGFCTEAVTIILDYLFLDKELQRIQALTVEENIPSQRVLETNGFKKEGTLRNLIFNRGCYRNCTLYSILRDEWEGPKILPYAMK
jgi:RimJ/RimL family protein N-acetyltransferase